MKVNRKIVSMVAISALLMTSIAGLAGCGAKKDGAATGGTIKVGSIQPVSGSASAYGTAAVNAINMAADEQNAKGGINGSKIEIINEDDENNPEKAKNAFKKLVTQDKVVGIIGPLSSNSALAIADDVNKRKIPLLTPTATADSLTGFSEYIFRACYNDSFQGSVITKFAINDLKLKTAAVIYDQTSDYSKALKDSFVKQFEAAGGKVITTEAYSKDDQDFNAQLTNIKKKNPDALFIPAFYDKVALIAKQVRNNGIKSTMLGVDGWTEIQSNAGDEVVGSYYSNHYSSDSKSPEVVAFVAAYKAKYGVEPNVLAALAYDGAKIMFQAIEKAGSTDPDKIKEALKTVEGTYVTGKISFDANRNPVKSAIIEEVIRGTEKNKPAIKYLTTVNP